MNMVIDDLDRHMAEAGSIERAAMPLAIYFAWCGNLHLFNPAFQQEHERALLRLRYREISPAEFFTATTGGAIESTVMSDDGRAFTEAHYDDCLEDVRTTFGTDVSSVADDWAHYDLVAPLLTRRFMMAQRGETVSRDNGNSGRRARWWQVWR